jgi:predicted nucleic acid-binding protein
MNQIINEIPSISVITKIEILGYETTPESAELLESFVFNSLVIGLSDEIVDRTIEIRKKNRIKMPDAIIAATAITYNSIIVTRNIKDFRNIKGLNVVNPHEI